MKLFITFFLFTISLLLAETVFAQHIAYIYSSNVTFLISIGFFGSLSIGNLLGLHPTFQKYKFSELHLLNASCLLFSLIGFFHFREAGILWMILSFLGAGVFLSQAFQKIQLKTLIISSGIASIIFYLLLNSFYRSFQAGIIPFTFLLSLAGYFISNAEGLPQVIPVPFFSKESPHLKKALIGFFGVFLILTLYRSNGFRMVSKLEQRSPGLANAQHIIPTDYTSLILTDLVWAPKLHSYYILTNGQRFSQVIQPKNLELNLQKIPVISLDAPYLISKPKKILIIGSAGGLNVWIALKYNPDEIVAVDINPAVFKIMNGRLLEETQSFYINPKIRMVVDEGRHFLETTKETFDLIVLQGVQTGTHNSVSNVAVLESFLFTKEAVQKMWSLLNPTGLIFLEEYKSLNSDIKEVGVTLLGSVAATSKKLVSDNPEDHLLFFQFPQSPQSPNGITQAKTGFRLREGLILSKVPIKDQAPVLTNALANQKFEILNIPTEKEFSDEHVISDNNPFFARQSATSNTFLILKILAGLFLSVIAYLLWTFRNLKQRSAYQSLFVLGIAYISFVMALIGPATLFMGHPQLAVPIVYGSLFFFAMLGGLIALKFPTWCSKFGSRAAAGIVAVLPLIYLGIKPLVLATPSLVVRGIILTIAIGLAGLILEWPYIAILAKLSDPKERAWGYSLGKLGVLVGMIIALWVELQLGFLGAVLTSVFFYLVAATLSFLSLRKTK